MFYFFILFLLFFIQNDSRFGGAGRSGGMRHGGGRGAHQNSPSRKTMNQHPGSQKNSKNNSSSQGAGKNNNYQHGNRNNPRNFNNNNFNNYAGFAGGGWGLAGLGVGTGMFLGLGMMAATSNPGYSNSQTYIINKGPSDEEIDNKIDKKLAQKEYNKKNKEYNYFHDRLREKINLIKDLTQTISKGFQEFNDRGMSDIISDYFKPFSSLRIVSEFSKNLFGSSTDEEVETVQFTNQHKLNKILSGMKIETRKLIEKLISTTRETVKENREKTTEILVRLKIALEDMNRVLVEVVKEIK